MPGSLERMRKSMTVGTTARNKGLTLTLHVTAYDNGMVEVDGIPINEAPRYDDADGWLGASEIVIATLNEFHRQVATRRRSASPHPSEQPRTGLSDTRAD